ncbi:MAG TPA: glycosyltransferase [Aliidongia sp.]|nr:glycosyltransferase [Aliidongia sp.]
MPSSLPLLSIVVGNYNYEKFVAFAVDSALRQTYRNIEVIVIDDGSTDGSRALLERYRDRVRLIFKENGGSTSTIHAGWAAARGEIVMFLDADDMLREDAARSVVAAWRPDIVKVQFPLTVIDAEGRPRGFVPAATRALGDKEIDRLVRRWGIYPTPPTSGNAYARRLLAEVLPLDTKRFKYGADGALNAVAPLYGSVISLGVSLGYYRVHGGNLWAGTQLDVDRFLGYVALGREEARFLKEHAARRGIRLSKAEPLDHSLVFLERRLAIRKMAPGHPASRGDHVLALFLKACRCVRIYERGLLRAALKLAWFLVTALAPPRLAVTLLTYHYVPKRRPALFGQVARFVRREAEPSPAQH